MDRFHFGPVNPDRLPARLLRIADAIEISTAQNPGSWMNHVHTGAAVRLDLRSSALDEPLREKLAERFPGETELLFVEPELRAQRVNAMAAIARLDEAVGELVGG